MYIQDPNFNLFPNSNDVIKGAFPKWRMAGMRLCCSLVWCSWLGDCCTDRHRYFCYTEENKASEVLGAGGKRGVEWQFPIHLCHWCAVARG